MRYRPKFARVRGTGGDPADPVSVSEAERTSRDLRLTGVAGSLQFGREMPEVSDREQVRGTMSDESRESLEDVRLEKLRKIAELGIDPWGHRFDGHRAIGEVRASAPPNEPEKEPAAGPAVRVAGRIMLRR